MSRVKKQTVTSFSATVRKESGKGAAKVLRRQGQVPGVVYSAGREPVSIQMGDEMAKAVVRQPAILSLEVEGTSYPCLVKEVQRHFLSGAIQHVDLLAVQADRRITAEVPVVHHGEAKGTSHGGILEQIGHKIRVQCLPGLLPKVITCDVTSLDAGQRILVRDMKLPEGITALSDPTTVMFAIHVPRAAVSARAAAAPAAAAAGAGAKGKK